MYITLTNASPNHRGTRIAINANAIVTVLSSVVDREDGTVEAVTFLFCPPHGTWEVTETYDEVTSRLNNTMTKGCEHCK